MLKTLRGVTPLWDLRRGDADDDRSSPHGRGWMSIVFSAALEFNYLSAPITFLLLIAGPALILGLVPPLVATYGQWAVMRSTVRAHPTIATLVWLMVVGALLVIGRRLFPRVLDALWQLKYTLIFPLFVGLRELISAALERLPGRLDTAEQFARRRRVGAALAALVLAGGATLVALTVEFSSGGRLVAAFNPRLWGIAKAGLWNAVVILSCSTAIVGLQWLWREIRASEPIREWTGRADRDATCVRVAHLSDLHIVGGRYAFRMESGTRGPRGNGRVQRALESVAELHASSPIECVLVSGDITDAGTRAEWIEFERLLADCRELRARMLFVPGNHDVNVVDPTNPGRLDLPGSMGQALRRLRVVLALDEFQGSTVHVVDRASGAPGPTLREYLRASSRQEALRELADSGTRRSRRAMGRVWEAVFPLVVPPRDDGGYGILLLDSNARRHLSLTNAMGIVGRSQLKAMRAVLRSSPERSWLVVLHHHVVEYPLPSIGLTERIGLSLANASELLDVVSAHPSPVVLLHGHRHRDWIGASKNMTLCSAPSVTLGSYNLDRSHGYFHVYEMQCADGQLSLGRSQVVAVT